MDKQELFNQHRNQLLYLCNNMRDFFNDDSINSRLTDIQKNLLEERFRLVVLGQFKRGKSTFINALIGKAILPADVIPVTAVITEIKYGKSPNVLVQFTKGKSREIHPNQLSDYVSESNNPRNKHGVDRVLIEYPAEILSKGLNIVDTPGIGSIHQHNTRLTQEYIPRVDAAIFLFSADPPLTELEQEFLKLIEPIVPRVFFILNKRDYLQEESLQRVIDFNQTIITSISGNNAEIFPISALQGLRARQTGDEASYAASGMKNVENTLHSFLMQHRGKFIILSNLERLERILLEQKNLIEMDRKAQDLSVETLREDLNKFQQYMKNFQRQEERISFLLEGLKTRLMEYFDEMAEKFLEENSALIQNQFLDFLSGERRLSKRNLLRKGEQMINEAIVDNFEPFRLYAEKELKEHYQTEIHQLNLEVTAALNEVYKYSADLFQIEELAKLPSNVWQFESQFYYKTWETLTTLDLLEKDILFLLPKPIFIHIQKYRILKLIKSKLDRQYGRLRADILYRLQDNNRQFVYEFKKALNRIEKEISGLIQRHLERKEEGEQILNELIQKQDQEEKFIDQVHKQLEEIKNSWETYS